MFQVLLRETFIKLHLKISWRDFPVGIRILDESSFQMINVFFFLMLLPSLVDLLFIVVQISFFICNGLCTTDDL